MNGRSQNAECRTRMLGLSLLPHLRSAISDLQSSIPRLWFPRLAGFAFLSLICVAAGTNAPADPDEIPPLRPPKPEILPGFWEQHGVLVGLAGIAILLAVALLWRVLARHKPPVIPIPSEVARQALHPLRQRQEDKELLAEVCSILRRYFIAAFVLPNQEFTNRELCRELAKHTEVGAALSKATAGLLEEMEHRRFDPEPSPSGTQSVELALQLIAQAETRLKPPSAGVETTHATS